MAVQVRPGEPRKSRVQVKTPGPFFLWGEFCPHIVPTFWETSCPARSRTDCWESQGDDQAAAILGRACVSQPTPPDWRPAFAVLPRLVSSCHRQPWEQTGVFAEDVQVDRLSPCVVVSVLASPVSVWPRNFRPWTVSFQTWPWTVSTWRPDHLRRGGSG